ncbi:AAA family ATPase [Eggerthella lenta]|uniref:AAA family ATPase n=1 Tax=Eggerthella lenta TaxID=84112 RepID=UPI002163CAAF|nr:AAA family ATPase [Eggerthella lenta]
MLKHLMEEEAESGVDRVYVTLDNTAILQTAKEDPALFLQRYRPPVLIDEIQKAPELLPYIKMIVDERDDCGSVWITGSQPLHLMKAVSESLAGRVGIVEMLGLSHSEVAGTPRNRICPAQTTSCGAWIWRSPSGCRKRIGRYARVRCPASVPCPTICARAVTSRIWIRISCATSGISHRWATSSNSDGSWRHALPSRRGRWCTPNSPGLRTSIRRLRRRGFRCW